MHWIQRYILKRLATADRLSYAELLPDGVEGNLFQYHARQLEKSGYISREGGYQLTAAGKELVAHMSLTRAMRRSDQPTPVVMIYATNDAGQILLFNWVRQPYRGLVSLPFGRLIRGRSALEMAGEQLLYKTGYRAEFEYAGAVEIITGEMHLLVSVVNATKLTGQHGSDGLTGVSYWGKWSEVALEQQLPGQSQILTWLAQSDRPAYTSWVESSRRD